MTNEQIIEQVIDRAVKNGFSREYLVDNKNHNTYYFAFIYRHDFAKTFWKTEMQWLPQGCDRLCANWRHHLSLMVLEKEPLQYLKKFLN